MNQAGLLFLKRNDPYSKVWMQITRQRYSHIGFYYIDQEGSDGVPEFVILICDLYHNCEAKWITTYTLSQLINDPLVEELVYRPLIEQSDLSQVTKQEESRLDNLKSAIANIVLKVPTKADTGVESADMTKLVYQIFGVVDGGKEMSSCPVNSVELVNLIFMNLNEWDIFDPREELEPAETGIFSVVNTLPIHNPDTTYRNINYYLGETKFFGPCSKLELPSHLHTTQARYLASANQKSFVTNVISTLIAKLNDDPRFSENISLYIKQVEAGSQDRLSRLEQLVTQLCLSHRCWLQLYDQMVKDKVMGANQVAEIQDWVWQSFNHLLNGDPMTEGLAFQMPQITPGLIALIPVLGREVRPNPNYVVTQLTQQVQDMATALHRGETAQLDINQLIQSVNFLNLSMGLPSNHINTLSTGDATNTPIGCRVNVIGLIDSTGQVPIPPQNHLIFSPDSSYNLNDLTPEVVMFLRKHLSREMTGSPALIKLVGLLGQ